MPYFSEALISFFWICEYNILNKFHEENLVFADIHSDFKNLKKMA